MTVKEALLCGILYWLAEANVPYFTVWTIQKPLVCGWITGCILGCPEAGALCGAVISLLYLGYRSHGSSMPSDIALGGICAAAAAAAGSPYGICALFAFPAGFAGILVWRFRLYGNIFFMKRTQESAQSGRFRSILLSSAAAPFLFSGAVCVPIGAAFSFAAFRFAELAAGSALFSGAMRGRIDSAGLILCAAGILFSLFPVHQKRTAVSFAAGTLAVLFSKASLPLLTLPAVLVFTAAVAGAGHCRFLSFLTRTGFSANDPDLMPVGDPDLMSADDPDFFSADDPDLMSADDPDFFPADDPDLMSSDSPDPENSFRGHKKKTSLPEAFSSPSAIPALAACNLIWILFVQAAYNTRLMMGQAAAAAFLPLLEVLHPGAPEEQRQVLMRQCVYLNTQPELGSCLIGQLAALEARRPAADPDKIHTVRQALMGIFGAIGDELFQCGWIPLLLLEAADLVLRGRNYTACILVYGLAALFSAGLLSAVSFRIGLTRDETGLLDLLESPLIHRIRHIMDLLLPFLKGAALGTFLIFVLLPAF